MPHEKISAIDVAVAVEVAGDAGKTGDLQQPCAGELRPLEIGTRADGPMRADRFGEAIDQQFVDRVCRHEIQIQDCSRSENHIGRVTQKGVLNAKRAGFNDSVTGVSVGIGERERAGADLLERARAAGRVLNEPIKGRRTVVGADGESRDTGWIRNADRAGDTGVFKQPVSF